MDLADNHFFTSATFWGPAVGVIAGALTTAVIVWVTLRAANPKRRLLYGMRAVTPLINSRPDLPQDIEVRRAGQALEQPQLVTVELASRGRIDIAREAFDGGEPLRLDLGVPIVECLKVATSPSDRPDPAWKTDGSALLVGPSHIGKRQTTVFSLLIDGASPHLNEPRQSLINVDLVRLRYVEVPASRSSTVGFWLVVLGVVVVVIFTISGLIQAIRLFMRPRSGSRSRRGSAG